MDKTAPHAQLITGGTQATRAEQTRNTIAVEELKNQPDLLMISRGDEGSIGIERIRELTHYLQLRAFQGTKKAVILEAQDLTTEAQNALLKTLEEPPGKSLIILTAPHPADLLPTVVSRCQIKRLPEASEIDFAGADYQKDRTEFLGLLGKNRGERLLWAEANKTRLADRKSARRTLSHWIAALRERLLEKPGAPQVGEWVGEIQEGLQLYQKLGATNLSPRLTLEYFLVKLPVTDASDVAVAPKQEP